MQRWISLVQKYATVFVVHIELPKIQESHVPQAIVEEARCFVLIIFESPIFSMCILMYSTLWSAEETQHAAPVSCNLNIELISLLTLCSANWKTYQTRYLDKLFKSDGCVGQVLPRKTTLVRRPFLHSVLVVLCKLWKLRCGCSKACYSGETAAALCKPGLSYFGPQCRAQLLGGDWFVEWRVLLMVATFNFICDALILH